MTAFLLWLANEVETGYLSSVLIELQAMYHVVFFDKEVSRTWVNAVCIRNFSCDDEPEDMGKVCLNAIFYS